MGKGVKETGIGNLDSRGNPTVGPMFGWRIGALAKPRYLQALRGVSVMRWSCLTGKINTLNLSLF